MNDWVIFDQVLEELALPRELIVYPERYMDQCSVTKRRAAIKEMSRRGETLDELEAKTPFTRRYLRDILANGSEPELPLGLDKSDGESVDIPGQNSLPFHQ